MRPFVPIRPHARPLLVLLLAAAAISAASAQELFVGNYTHTIAVFHRSDNGDAAPQRILSGASTGMNLPRGIAVDVVHDEIFVTNYLGNSITVYARTATGDTAPIRTIGGDKTLLDYPYGIAL
ncbi:MAG: hypothetical protein ACM3OA_12950, partial [Acidobacteriota bacterium]